MRTAVRVLLGSGVAFAAAAVIASEPRDAIDVTVAEYFRPFQNELAALAPDGKHLALSETLRDQTAAIVIVTVNDHSRQRFPLGDEKGVDHAVEQLLWISPTRLVFTTRSRVVGMIDVTRGETRALLLSRDLDAYLPKPELGPRRRDAGTTPEMDPNTTTDSPNTLLSERREMSVAEALKQARVTGDLFGRDSKRDPGTSLRPFLLGPKPGAKDTVLLEFRPDGDLFSLNRPESRRVQVPGNVVVYDRTRGELPENEPPTNPLLGHAVYDIDYGSPPFVVVELELTKGRTRQLVTEQDWRRIWLDQQGELRLALEQRGIQLRYLYRKAKGGKWVPLESVVKTEPRLNFEVGPETLLAPRSVPLGFDANGRVLFIATNVGRDTFGLRAVDVESGALVKDFEMIHAQFDLIEPTTVVASDVLQFDPYTRNLAGVRFAAARRETTWLNAEVAAIQAGLSKKFAPLRCEVRGWDSERTRFLVEIAAPHDPGGFAVFEPGAMKFTRFGDRAPWLTEERLNHTHIFDFTTDDGRRLAGSLTVPRHPRVNPAPVLVYFHDGPWFSDPPLFNRGGQALAALGFAVVQLNHRGSSGYGRKHLSAIDDGLDRVVLEDVRAMLARVGAGKLPINTRLVATLGNGVGGYLAVRMLQLAPETFRCAVAINAPGDLAAWQTHTDAARTMWPEVSRQYFGRDRERLRASSAIASGKATRKPVLVAHAADNAYVPVAMGRELYRALKEGAEGTAYLELPGEGHGGWSENTTARLFAELGRFFNATIYNYGVEVRPAEVVR